MHATNKKQDTMEMFLGSVWENLRNNSKSQTNYEWHGTYSYCWELLQNDWIIE